MECTKNVLNCRLMPASTARPHLREGKGMKEGRGREEERQGGVSEQMRQPRHALEQWQRHEQQSQARMALQGKQREPVDCQPN